MENYRIKILLFVFAFIAFGFGNVLVAKAFSEGELRKFYVDSSYDLYGRKEIESSLIRTTDNLYFYVEKAWWDSRSQDEQNRVRIAFFDLGEEFKNKIYPVLTSNFGQEWKPGIDGDERITVLLHPMGGDKAGYFRINDEYSKFQTYDSNEREMIYLSSEFIANPLIKSFLAHEFVHLITFNQKERLRGAREEIWLNEARAEYGATLLGYDDQYEGSNLQKRVRVFLENPSFSLTEWQGVLADYGVLNLFTQYLLDHYGIAILRDSLYSSETGIASLNYALRKNGFQEDFSQIFTNWTITVLVNDCSLGNKYCYQNQNLKNIRIVPESNFLPMATEISLSVYSQVKDWSAKWQRIFGGKGNLTLTFNGDSRAKFRVPYVLCDYAEKCAVKFFNLNEKQKGEIIISEFGSKYSSLTMVPSVQQKLSGFSNNEPVYPFSWDARTKQLLNGDEELIKELLLQISLQKAEIARVQAAINAILASRGQKEPISLSCQSFENNLYFGMSNNLEVRCLQQFLKDQGLEIYPEGLITGNFLSLTQQAVIRFQEKYASEILAPIGFEKGTGYFGTLSRQKANQLIHR